MKKLFNYRNTLVLARASVDGNEISVGSRRRALGRRRCSDGEARNISFKHSFNDQWQNNLIQCFEPGPVFWNRQCRKSTVRWPFCCSNACQEKNIFTVLLAIKIFTTFVHVAHPRRVNQQKQRTPGMPNSARGLLFISASVDE